MIKHKDYVKRVYSNKNKGQDELVHFMMNGLKDLIFTGLEEEPEKFIFTKIILEVINMAEVDLKNIDENIFERVREEFVDYLI